MNWGLAGILFAILVLGLLLAVLLFRTRWHRAIKAAAILCVMIFIHATVKSYPLLTGWPTTTELPERFNLMGVQFEEPNKSTQTKGWIYLWVTDLMDFDNQTPRAYVLPYKAELHSKLYDAGQKLRKSLPQLGEVIRVRNSITGKLEIDLQFYDMPEVLMPK
jgi:hypothetical protein